MRSGLWNVLIGALLMLGAVGLLFAMVVRFIEPNLFLSILAYGGSLFGVIVATTGLAHMGLPRPREVRTKV